MRSYKLLSLFMLGLLFSCNPKDLGKNFTLIVDPAAKTFTSGDVITLSLKVTGDIKLDSVVYLVNGEPVGSKKDTSPLETTLGMTRLGRKEIGAVLFSEGKTSTLSADVTLVSKTAPKLYTYEILNTYPHDTKSYTQGLEFHDGNLYESVGEYGSSKLLKIEYKTGKILEEIKLADTYFAEGLTIIDDRLLQLTWKEDLGFIYDLATFKKTGSFAYGESREGWGLCNDGKVIYKSDGSTKIWMLDPKTLAETDHIEVADNKKLRSKYNELEWVGGKIYGNTYQNDGISIIDPQTGAIEAVVDLRSLKSKVQDGLNKDNEVLNGIALNPETGTIFVTGKHWNSLFEIKIIKE